MAAPDSRIAERLADLRKRSEAFTKQLKTMEAELAKPKAAVRSHSDCATEQMARDAAWGMYQMAEAAEVAIAGMHTAASQFTAICAVGWQAAETALADCLAS